VIAGAELIVAIGVLFEPVPQLARRAEVTEHMIDLAPLA
jgi:hypothetical protein